MSITTEPFKYSDSFTPKGYCCSTCGMEGVKLWREYNTFLDHQKLYCLSCGLKKNIKEIKKSKLRIPSDQIWDIVPAVPTEEGDTYWGYTSVPQDGVNWWYSLPPHIKLFQPPGENC